MSCYDGWSYPQKEINGTCPDCGIDTVDGEAYIGCNYSSLSCETCGSRECNESC